MDKTQGELEKAKTVIKKTSKITDVSWTNPDDIIEEGKISKEQAWRINSNDLVIFLLWLKKHNGLSDRDISKEIVDSILDVESAYEFLKNTCDYQFSDDQVAAEFRDFAVTSYQRYFQIVVGTKKEMSPQQMLKVLDDLYDEYNSNKEAFILYWYEKIYSTEQEHNAVAPSWKKYLLKHLIIIGLMILGIILINYINHLRY